MKKLKILMVAGAATMLSSCDLSQIPGLDGKLSIEDSKAVGAACRHSGRALEDCFTLNPRTHQAGVFDGWRDMNDYMLANEIDVVKPEIRNSAFSQDKASADAATGSPDVPVTSAGSSDGSAEVPAGDPANRATQAVPLVQGRQRWLPKGLEQPATVEPPASGANAPAPVVGKEEPATDAPARPWERKKDPKKHT